MVYEEGKKAYWSGLTLKDNPYWNSMLQDAWENGWLDAEDEDLSYDEDY